MNKIITLTTDCKPDLPDAQIRYYQKFLSNKEANHFFDAFISKIPWREDQVKVFGKMYAQPRLLLNYYRFWKGLIAFVIMSLTVFY